MTAKVLYNRSLEGLFGEQARQVAQALGCEAVYTDTVCVSGTGIDFDRCVYFDKDVVAGLRLEAAGVRLFNNIGSVEICDDKRRTCVMLENDLRIPETVCSPLLFSDDAEFFEEYEAKIADRLGFPLVAKQAYGSLGGQVRLIEDRLSLRVCIADWKNTPHLFQKFIASSRGRDLRVYVAGGEAVACMERSNPNDFRSNVGAGGHGKCVTAPDGYEQTAVDACAMLGLDFGGVDLLYGEDGAPYVCEVNSNALFRELNRVCGVRVEDRIADVVRREKPFADGLF